MNFVIMSACTAFLPTVTCYIFPPFAWPTPEVIRELKQDVHQHKQLTF